MNHLWFGIAIDHDFIDIHQAAGQREGTDAAGKDRAVGDPFHGFFDGVDVDAGTATAYGGNGQSIGFHLGGDHSSPDRRHLVIADDDVGSKAFRFHGKIHQTNGGGGIHPVRHHFHAFGISVAVGNQLFYVNSHKLHGGKGQNRQGFFGGFCDLFAHPSLHVSLHKQHTSSFSSILSYSLFFSFRLCNTSHCCI
ncbi:hypothetical protein DSECCO2_587340 [anaerobic digester metagenome]